MTSPVELARLRRDQLLEAAASHGISNVRVLTAGAAVDRHPAALQLIVDVEPDRPGIEFFAFAAEAEDLLSTAVEVGTDYRSDAPLRVERL